MFNIIDGLVYSLRCASFILLIGLPLFFGYLKLRVLLANEPFSLAWSFSELEPPIVNVSAAAYVCNSKLRRVCHVPIATARQPRNFTDNELHLLASFHGISSPAYNCRSYLYERARLEIKCNFLTLISSSYDVSVASYT